MLRRGACSAVGRAVVHSFQQRSSAAGSQWERRQRSSIAAPAPPQCRQQTRVEGRSKSRDGEQDSRPLACGAKATLLINGMLPVQCGIPLKGSITSAVKRVGPELNVMGDRGGLTLDALLVAPAAAALPEDGRWTGTLYVRCGQKEEAFKLGSLRAGARSCHVAVQIPADATAVRVEVTADGKRRRQRETGPAEERLVADVAAALTSLDSFGGSLSNVLLSNKARELPGYDPVVGGVYRGAWVEFVRRHSDALRLFRYTEEEVEEHSLAPLAKAGDMRIAAAERTPAEIAAADSKHAATLRRQAAGVESFLVDVLQDGDMEQTDLLERLKECPEFCEMAVPTPQLLQRFLAANANAFVWSSSPDLVTRVGVSAVSRYPHHTRPCDFAAPEPAKQKKRAPAAAAPQPSPEWVAASPSPQPSECPAAADWAPPVAAADAEGCCEWQTAVSGGSSEQLTMSAGSEYPSEAGAAAEWAAEQPAWECYAAPSAAYRHDPYGVLASQCAA